MINYVEETPCPAHGGHNKLTLTLDAGLFDKLEFEAYEKEKMTHSLQGKIAAEEGHVKTKRPWEALQTMLARAVIRSDTKLAMAEIGISLHGSKSKEMYSVQFVCNSCLRSTDVLFPVCDDRCLRDQADRTMVQFFRPYFELMNVSLPDPPPPPPPALGYVQTPFAPPKPAPRTGSRNSMLLPLNAAELKHMDRISFQRQWGEETDTTASVTSRCGKSDGSSRSAANAVVPYCPRTIHEREKYWECYWNHGRSQQPVDAADRIDGDAQLQWRRGGQQWQWTGDGPNDWEWSPFWSLTGDGQWQWD